MASKPRTRIYEIEDIDTENVDVSFEELRVEADASLFLFGLFSNALDEPPRLRQKLLFRSSWCRCRVSLWIVAVPKVSDWMGRVHQHDLHEFPHRIRIKEITTDEEYEIRPIGQRVREWFLGRGGATDRETVSATTVHPILDKAREAGTSATERIKSAAYEASPSAASVVSAVSTAATEAVHGGARVVEGAERIAEAVTAPISRVVHSASSVYGAATSSVSRAAGEVEDRAEDMAREARRRLEQAGQAARNTAGNLVLGSSIGSRSGSMIDQAPVTALYTVLGTLILVWLMRRVWLQRWAVVWWTRFGRWVLILKVAQTRVKCVPRGWNRGNDQRGDCGCDP